MKRVLFVCIHNAGRSVMAEAFANKIGEGKVGAKSAGTIPSDAPHPEIVEVMREVGIDVSGHSGTMITDEMVHGADRVITMGCAVDEGACPAIRYANLEDWGLPDPKGQPLEKVRLIRDDIEERVQKLVEEIA